MSAHRRRWSLLLAGLLLLACDAGSAGARGPQKPGFRLPTLDGKELGPADFAGKVVVADFWATWCGPCFLQADILHRLHELYPQADVQFLAIDVGEDEKTVRAFTAKRPIPYPVLLDEEEKVSGDLRVAGFPTLLILNRKGEVSYLRAGIVPEKRMRELLTLAGAQLPETPEETPAAGTPAKPVPPSTKASEGPSRP
ncbi:MAG TPA: TlpA disulfide reductase family protein [Thermoanaerobaculia bacterium]|jgi:thiol-disulfide isomerase/thioredoxin|nr:TlpA disulfide reductase family protein [Thermoanaerobaculia bacterium]